MEYAIRVGLGDAHSRSGDVVDRDEVDWRVAVGEQAERAVLFVSNAFVPLESFDGVLRTLVEWNPVSALTQASRELFGNVDARVPAPDAWPMQHAELYTLIWVALILAVFVPLSVRQFQRSAGRG